jgi:hypothetical protein
MFNRFLYFKLPSISRSFFEHIPNVLYTDNVAAREEARISIKFMWATLGGNLRNPQ